MSWAKDLTLWLDLDAAPTAAIVNVVSSVAYPASCPPLMQGDLIRLKLHLGHRAMNGGWTVETLAAGDAIMVAGKKQDLSGSTLFSATGFASEGDGNSTLYAADLNLNTAQLAAALTGDELNVLVDVEIEGSGLRATRQFPTTIKKQVYNGTPETVDGLPTYYTQAQIDAKLSIPAGVRLRVTAAGEIVVEAVS